MPTYKTKLITLKHKNLFEADRLITAFSFEYGKIRFIAKGVRKTKSKYAGSLEPFSESDVIISKGRNLDILSSADLKSNYLKNIQDLEKIKTASQIAEIVIRVTDENHVSQPMFDLLETSFTNLQNYSSFTIYSFFLINFFQISGVSPHTNTCVHCGEKPSENISFSLLAGGILDENCAKYFEDAGEISIQAVKYLNIAKQYNLDFISKVKIDDHTAREIESLLNKYFVHNFDIQLKSLKFDQTS